MKRCPKCQCQNVDNANFCAQCGTHLTDSFQTIKTKKTVVERINDYMGNDKPAELNWKVLFTEVFKKHTMDDAEAIFIAGTETTTPDPKDITSSWPHPWLYSRVLLTFLVSLVLLLLMTFAFDNNNGYPGVILLGSFAIPMAAMVLFMEMNVFRDVSFYEASKFFLLGGCASLVMTLILNEILYSGELDVFGAIMTGITEEVAKLLIIFYFIRKTPYRSILSGLLIGAAVGAGFAAFESAGYAFRSLLAGGDNDMLIVLFLRAFLAPGGHVAWAAISGGALMIAAQQGEITGKLMFEPKFLRLFIIPVVLHALWDMPFMGLLGCAILLVAVWIVVMVLFNMGLSEAEKISDAANRELRF